MTRSELLQYTKEDRLAILQKFGRDDESVQKDVKSLENSGFLPEHIDNTTIELFLILNKFSEEKTRKKLELYYTTRNALSRIYGPTYATSSDIQKIMDCAATFALPKLVGTSRIILQTFSSDCTNFSARSLGQLVMQVLDLMMKFDYLDSVIIIMDLRNFTFKHAARAEFLVFKDMAFVIQKICSGRIKAVHLLSPPKIVETMTILLRPIVKEKIFNRVSSLIRNLPYVEERVIFQIKIHKDLKSLRELIPEDCLPKDYGGLQESVEELTEKWKDFLIEQEPYFQYLNSIKIDENSKFVENDTGCQGNVGKLKKWITSWVVQSP